MDIGLQQQEVSSGIKTHFLHLEESYGELKVPSPLRFVFPASLLFLHIHCWESPLSDAKSCVRLPLRNVESNTSSIMTVASSHFRFVHRVWTYVLSIKNEWTSGISESPLPPFVLFPPIDPHTTSCDYQRMYWAIEWKQSGQGGEHETKEGEFVIDSHFFSKDYLLNHRSFALNSMRASKNARRAEWRGGGGALQLAGPPTSTKTTAWSKEMKSWWAWWVSREAQRCTICSSFIVIIALALAKGNLSIFRAHAWFQKIGIQIFHLKLSG